MEHYTRAVREWCNIPRIMRKYYLKMQRISRNERRHELENSKAMHADIHDEHLA